VARSFAASVQVEINFMVWGSFLKRLVQLVDIFSTYEYYRQRRSIKVFTRFRQTLSWASWIQPTILKLHLVNICFNIILHFIPTRVPFKWSSLQDFPSKYLLPTVL